MILARPNTLQSIFINLIDNAIKYSPPKNQVCILVSYDHEMICVDIHDNGRESQSINTIMCCNVLFV